MGFQLERSHDDRMLGGVCAGIARFYDLDVTVVRVVAAILGVKFALVMVVYLVLWAVLPVERRR